MKRSIGLAQDTNGKYYPLPLYSINEFEKDRVVTTALINKNFPLIRYAVEDRITLKSHDFLKNLVSPDIVQIEGRAGDNLTWKMEVGCIDHAFKGVNNLEMAQVHQYNVEKPIEIKLVTSPAGQDDETSESKFHPDGWENMQLMFTYCSREDLTYSANQKYKLIIKHRQ